MREGRRKERQLREKYCVSVSHAVCLSVCHLDNKLKSKCDNSNYGTFSETKPKCSWGTKEAEIKYKSSGREEGNGELLWEGGGRSVRRRREVK